MVSGWSGELGCWLCPREKAGCLQQRGRNAQLDSYSHWEKPLRSSTMTSRLQSRLVWAGSEKKVNITVVIWRCETWEEGEIEDAPQEYHRWTVKHCAYTHTHTHTHAHTCTFHTNLLQVLFQVLISGDKYIYVCCWPVWGLHIAERAYKHVLALTDPVHRFNHQLLSNKNRLFDHSLARIWGHSNNCSRTLFKLF